MSGGDVVDAVPDSERAEIMETDVHDTPDAKLFGYDRHCLL